MADKFWAQWIWATVTSKNLHTNCIYATMKDWTFFIFSWALHSCANALMVVIEIVVNVMLITNVNQFKCFTIHGLEIFTTFSSHYDFQLLQLVKWTRAQINDIIVILTHSHVFISCSINNLIHYNCNVKLRRKKNRFFLSFRSQGKCINAFSQLHRPKVTTIVACKEETLYCSMQHLF